MLSWMFMCVWPLIWHNHVRDWHALVWLNVREFSYRLNCTWYWISWKIRLVCGMMLSMEIYRLYSWLSEFIDSICDGEFACCIDWRSMVSCMDNFDLDLFISRLLTLFHIELVHIVCCHLYIGILHYNSWNAN